MKRRAKFWLRYLLTHGQKTAMCSDTVVKLTTVATIFSHIYSSFTECILECFVVQTLCIRPAALWFAKCHSFCVFIFQIASVWLPSVCNMLAFSMEENVKLPMHCWSGHCTFATAQSKLQNKNFPVEVNQSIQLSRSSVQLTFWHPLKSSTCIKHYKSVCGKQVRVDAIAALSTPVPWTATDTCKHKHCPTLPHTASLHRVTHILHPFNAMQWSFTTATFDSKHIAVALMQRETKPHTFKTVIAFLYF